MGREEEGEGRRGTDLYVQVGSSVCQHLHNVQVASVTGPVE